LALLLGDNFYEDGVSFTSDPQWQAKFASMCDPMALDFPFYAVLGNHDYHGNESAEVQYSIEDPGSRWKMPARYYSFSKLLSDGTKIDLFAPDSEVIEAEDAQLAWLRKELAASTAAGAHWKIVFAHHPLYSNDQLGLMAFRVSKPELVACVVLENGQLDFCYTITK
jgi:tartrate-resistant acid phosphatase type 5